MRLQTHAEPNRRLKIFPELRDTSKGQREVVDFVESGAGVREKRVPLRQRDHCEEAPHRGTGGSTNCRLNPGRLLTPVTELRGHL